MHAACGRYRQAIEAAPGYAKAHLNLGIGLEAMGEVEPARKAYEAALAIDAANAYANYNLGKLLFARGAPSEAEPLLRRALRSKPDFPEAQVVLAGLLEANGDLAAAAAALEEALRQRPDYFGALHNYAAILIRLNRASEAESVLRRLLTLAPEATDAAGQLAALLMNRGALNDAAGVLLRAITHNPRSVEAQAMLFELYRSQGNLAAAAAALEAALKLRPDWVDALYNYGLLLKKQMRLDEGEAAFRRALALDPSHVRTYRILGSVLLGECRIEDALRLYRTGRENCNDPLALESAEMFALNCLDDISSDELFRCHAAYGARQEKAHPARFEHAAKVADAQRRLRVGYISGDLQYHVVTSFLLPLIERHDRALVEVYCYSTGDMADEYTRKLMAHADVWREAGSLSETELADLIHRDRIDILVDLAGHSGVPNLAVFAQRPAPVQATWLGYLNTTGLTRIQYRISDEHCDPPGLTDRQHTETLVRLPHSQWCYRPFVTVESAREAPFERNGFVTFGSFNQAVKLSRTVRRLWAEILMQAADARLMVVGLDAGRAGADFLRDMEAAGVNRERITLVPYVPLEDYFRLYNQVDIALDTSPYSGGTTTCDALWMGVPVVTVPGERPSSRSAASLLTTVGLADWIASTPEDYVKRAVNFARERTTVAELRRTLRTRMRQSPLMDEERFARDMEEAYRRMWRSWCAGERD